GAWAGRCAKPDGTAGPRQSPPAATLSRSTRPQSAPELANQTQLGGGHAPAAFRNAPLLSPRRDGWERRGNPPSTTRKGVGPSRAHEPGGVGALIELEGADADVGALIELEGADADVSRADDAALVGGAQQTRIAGGDGRAAAQQGTGLGRS